MGHPGQGISGDEVKIPTQSQTTRQGWGNLAGEFDFINYVPWIYAAADAMEPWWIRMRGNPKRLGEISQAAFLLQAEMRGYGLAVPWGDSEKYDFVVWLRDGRKMLRVQVKGTGRLYRGGYEVQPVRTERGGKKKRYTKKDIDLIAAHVQPLDAWYLIPIEAVGRAKSLRLYPEEELRCPPSRTERGKGGATRRRKRRAAKCWEQYRENWAALQA